MGWTYGHRDKGVSNLDYFGAMWPADSGYKLLDAASVGSTVYGAVKTPDGDVTAVVFLTNWHRNDYFNFGYKDMSESMGPYSYDAPARILALLTETTDPYAIAWRAKVRENLARVAAAKAVKPGTTVRFATPISFSNGVTGDTFTFTGKNGLFRSPGGGLYRIGRNWTGKAFEVVTS